MITKPKLLLLDKDGTVTRTKSGERFVQHPGDQILVDGIHSATLNYDREGNDIYLISNQGGIEAGHKTIGQTIDEFVYAMQLFSPACSAYFCPGFDPWGGGNLCYWVDSSPCRGAAGVASLPDIEVFCREAIELRQGIEGGVYRKPNPGMIDLAIANSLLLDEHPNLNREDIDILMVGDREEDQRAAQAAGVRFKWVQEFIEEYE